MKEVHQNVYCLGCKTHRKCNIMTNSEVQVYSNEIIDLPVKEVDGQVYFDSEAAAIGLGIYLEKSGAKYVRWERVRKYLNSPQVEKGDWITEQQFYKLAFKANNEVAEKFQDWVASEVLPAIRKHGAYMTPDKIDEILSNPDTIIQLAIQLKQEREKVKKEREQRLIAEQRVSEYEPKASYYDLILQNKSLMNITQIAKDYGMSGAEMNKKLHELGVQFKQSGNWLLYAKYQKNGWTQSTTELVNHGKKVVLHTKWTQKGRIGIYQILKENCILPLIEREDFE